MPPALVPTELEIRNYLRWLMRDYDREPWSCANTPTSKKAPTFHATTEGQLIGEGNEVAYRWTFRGTYQGEFFGVRGTANRIEMSGIQIDRFDESGKLVEEWPEYDLLGAMRQMASISGPYYFR